MAGIWKSLEVQSRRSIKQSIMNSSGTNNRNVGSEGRLMKFQRTRTPLGIGLETTHIILKEFVFCLCPESLNEAAFKGNGMINSWKFQDSIVFRL